MVKCAPVPILFKRCCPLCLPSIPTATQQQEERNPQDTLRLDGQPDVANGHGSNLRAALPQAGRCPGLGEQGLSDPHGFDFNGGMPTRASLAELLTALYRVLWELISCSMFPPTFFLFLSAPGYLFCLLCFWRRLGTEEARNQQPFLPKTTVYSGDGGTFTKSH